MDGCLKGLVSRKAKQYTHEIFPPCYGKQISFSSIFINIGQCPVDKHNCHEWNIRMTGYCPKPVCLFVVVVVYRTQRGTATKQLMHQLFVMTAPMSMPWPTTEYFIKLCLFCCQDQQQNADMTNNRMLQK